MLTNKIISPNKATFLSNGDNCRYLSNTNHPKEFIMLKTQINWNNDTPNCFVEPLKQNWVVIV